MLANEPDENDTSPPDFVMWAPRYFSNVQKDLQGPNWMPKLGIPPNHTTFPRNRVRTPFNRKLPDHLTNPYYLNDDAGAHNPVTAYQATHPPRQPPTCAYDTPPRWADPGDFMILPETPNWPAIRGARPGDQNDPRQTDSDEQGMARTEYMEDRKRFRGHAAAHPPTPRPFKRWMGVRLHLMTGNLPWPTHAYYVKNTAGQLIYSLYDEVEEISHIRAGPITKAVTAPKKGAHLHTEQYYEVTWKDTVIVKGAIEAYEHASYTGTAAPHTKYGTVCKKYFARMQWAPTSEPAKKCPEIHGWPQAIRAHRQKLSAPLPPKPQPAPNDAHLTSPQQQGRWTKADVEATRTRRDTRQNTRIDTNPCNPYLDIRPTGAYTIQIPDIYMDTPAHVYGPTGRHIATINLGTLLTLKARYEHALTTYPEATRPHRAEGGFPEDLARLLIRTKVDNNGKTSKEAPPRERTLSGPLKTALFSCLT